MPINFPLFGQPITWYGPRPQGSSGGPPTGATGFRHPYYLHRGQPVKYGFAINGSTSGGTGTTGFRHYYYLHNGQPVRYGILLQGTSGGVPPTPTTERFTVSGPGARDLFGPIGDVSWNWAGGTQKRTV